LQEFCSSPCISFLPESASSDRLSRSYYTSCQNACLHHTVNHRWTALHYHSPSMHWDQVRVHRFFVKKSDSLIGSAPDVFSLMTRRFVE
jgi:hypothetical protein